MVIFKDVAKALSYLSKDGAPVEVMVSYDSRAADQKTYFGPLQEMREQWSKNGKGRVCIEIFGVEPDQLQCCGKKYHYTWCKVALAKLIGSQRRVKYFMWLDSDACPAPILSTSYLDSAHKCQNAQLQFPSLHSVFNTRASSMDVVLVGYRECFQNGARCPKGCGCKELFRGKESEVRGVKTKREGHHSFNAGAWILKCDEDSRWLKLVNAWLKMKPASAALKGKWGGSEHEQGSFDTCLACRSDVTLTREREFASQTLRVETDSYRSPYLHWYGSTTSPWTSKQLIPRYFTALYKLMNNTQRHSMPRLSKYCLAVLGKKGSKLAIDHQKARARVIKGVRRIMAKPVRIKGKRYPSQRAARDALQLSHAQLKKLMK